MRGIPGAYKRAMETLDALRRAGLMDIGIGFTMLRGNEDELLRVYDMALANDWEFASTIVHSSPIFFGNQHDKDPDLRRPSPHSKSWDAGKLKSGRPKDWFRAWFTGGVIDLARGQRRPVKCPALSRFFYLDPAGTVYTCHILDEACGPAGRRLRQPSGPASG